MWKRISAFLLDFILLGTAAVLFALALSWTLGYDGYSRIVLEKYQQYGEEYGVDMRLSAEEYEALDDEARQRVDDAFDAINGDGQAVHADQMLRRLRLVIVTGGVLLAFLSLEFAVPLWLKNGRTVGKKVFGLAVMRTDGVKITHVLLFIRTFLGKFTIETMIPLLIGVLTFMGALGVLGTVILLLILLIEAAVLISTPTRSLIHDLMAGTVVVDFGSQMIFDTREAMIAYKEKIHAEMAKKEEY